jgi:hypothetical protein
MKWILIANAIGAAGNFYFAGLTGDRINLLIGIFNLVIVVTNIALRETHNEY